MRNELQGDMIRSGHADRHTCAISRDSVAVKAGIRKYQIDRKGYARGCGTMTGASALQEAQDFGLLSVRGSARHAWAPLPSSPSPAAAALPPAWAWPLARLLLLQLNLPHYVLLLADIDAAQINSRAIVAVIVGAMTAPRGCTAPSVMVAWPSLLAWRAASCRL